jgi:hypothetical protein
MASDLNRCVDGVYITPSESPTIFGTQRSLAQIQSPRLNTSYCHTRDYVDERRDPLLRFLPFLIPFLIPFVLEKEQRPHPFPPPGDAPFVERGLLRDTALPPEQSTTPILGGTPNAPVADTPPSFKQHGDWYAFQVH